MSSPLAFHRLSWKARPRVPSHVVKPQSRVATAGGEESIGFSSRTSGRGCGPSSSPPSFSPANGVGCNRKLSVKEFLRGRTLVLTGGTGFLAKVFLEKLLWEQGDVRKIFLIITTRPRKGAAVRLREQIIDNPLFDRLRARHGEDFQAFIDERLVPLAGNLGAENLGLSPEDEASVVAEAEVFVNSAATTTFNERFDVAVNINTLGPRRLLHLSRKCKKAILMCHVSTAYVNGLRRGPAREQAFNLGDCIARELSQEGEGPILNPYAEVDLALKAGKAAATKASEELFDEKKSQTIGGGGEKIDTSQYVGCRSNRAGDWARSRQANESSEPQMLPLLDQAAEAELVQLGSERARLHGWQDTYVFTKAMGEQLLVAERGNLPLVIIRPSIVEGSLREPFPGWIEGIRMADPLILAYGKGLIRGFIGDSAGVLDLVPVDAVVGVMLASLPEAASKTLTRVEKKSEELESELGPVYRNRLKNTPDSDFICGKTESADDVVVYHVATSTLNPLNFTDFMQTVSRYFLNSPLIDRRSGKPIHADSNIEIFSSRFMFELDTWLRQGGTAATTSLLQGLFSPSSTSGVNKRRKEVKRRTLEQLRSMGELYEPYTSYKARFQSDNVKALRASLSDEERKAFPFDLEELDWTEYLSSVHIPGLLKHALRIGEK